MSVLSDDQMNSVINCLTAKSTWDDLILYQEGHSDVKESRVMDLKLCYNTFKFKEDSLDDEEDTRRSHEYLNDLEEEYQARSLLAKSKRFFKKGTQRFSSAKATDQTECHKCDKKGHFTRDCWSKTSVPSYQSPFQLKSLGSPQNKPELRLTKDFEAKYNKVKAKLALLSSSALASKASTIKNKVCSTPLPLLKKLNGVEPIYGPKTIKLILRSKSTFKAKTLKGVIINEPSLALAKDNKSSSASKVNSVSASKLKSVKIKDDPPLAIVIKELNNLKLQFSKSRIISLEREINLRNPQHAFKRCEVCGSSTHTKTDYYYIEWFKRGEALQAKKVEALKSTRAESSNTNRSKTPTKSGSPSGTGVKSYLHKYVEQPGPKVVFGDDSTCEGYGSIKCNRIVSQRVFNTRRQQTKETYHITFDESPDAIKFLKPLVDNINIAENERYPPDEYLHPYEPSQRWSLDKHIELVNIIGNPGAVMLTRAMANQLSAASAYECLFVDFLSKEEPKKVSEALKHPGWVAAMQDELNQFAKNKIKQSETGISINQKKYVNDLLKNYDINGSPVKTLMVPPNNLGLDLSGKAVNETQYRGFDLKGYSDSDYAGCNMDRKSTPGKDCAQNLQKSAKNQTISTQE
nr:retrovirus-related Pol polyprotein from transposon TNT 1-94 [Tanacetum cinerariifolium]